MVPVPGGPVPFAVRVMDGEAGTGELVLANADADAADQPACTDSPYAFAIRAKRCEDGALSEGFALHPAPLIRTRSWLKGRWHDKANWVPIKLCDSKTQNYSTKSVAGGKSRQGWPPYCIVFHFIFLFTSQCSLWKGLKGEGDRVRGRRE